jgi:hypothetical protein
VNEQQQRRRDRHPSTIPPRSTLLHVVPTSSARGSAARCFCLDAKAALGAQTDRSAFAIRSQRKSQDSRNGA